MVLAVSDIFMRSRSYKRTFNHQFIVITIVFMSSEYSFIIAARVVSLESFRKFIPIFLKIFISGKFSEIFTKNAVQTFEITVYLFTSSLSIITAPLCTNSNSNSNSNTNTITEDRGRLFYNIVFVISWAHRHCMHVLFEIHSGFRIIRNIYNWGKFREISS